MNDFLEYMQALNAWQTWGQTQPIQRFLHQFAAFTVSAHQTRSPKEIFQFSKQHQLLQHPWLLAFEDAQHSPTVIRTWLKQRYLLSWCFPNWLTGVMAKLPTANTRIPLLMNLYEEHGLVEGSAHHSKPHPQMWQQLFEELGAIAPGQPLPLPTSESELLRGTQFYIQIYTQACFGNPITMGLGAMAFTESILPHENQLILRGLDKMGISPQGKEFFAVHCDCDEAHADEITGVIDQVANTPAALRQVWQGVQMAALARKAFYDTLWSFARIENTSTEAIAAQKVSLSQLIS